MVLGGDQSIPEQLTQLLAGDPLSRGGTFGGEQCASYVSPQIRMYERIAWLVVCLLAYKLFSLKKYFDQLRQRIAEQLSQTTVSTPIRIIELMVGYGCVGIFMMLCLFKANSNSLCYIFQPCHIIILSQGLALICDDEYSVLSQLMLIPTLSGTSLALLFPETEDLVQPFEEPLFWIEHYTLQVLPIYLLLRRNGVFLKNVSISTALCGAWVLMCYHYLVIDVMNEVLKTNVQFMMCPITPAKLIMNYVHPSLLRPSYRSFFTALFLPLSIFGSEGYRLVGVLIQKLLPKSVHDDHKKFC